MAAAFEQERDEIQAQIANLASQRDSLGRENTSLKQRLAHAEPAAANAAEATRQLEELRERLTAAEEAAAAGEERGLAESTVSKHATFQTFQTATF